MSADHVTRFPPADVDHRDPAVEPLRPESSLGELFSELATNLGDLVRKETELAKVELHDELDRAKAAAIGGAVAAIGALLGLVALTFALALWLDEVMPDAVAFLLVGALWLAVAAAAAAMARRRLEQRAFPQTTQTVKEDVAWITTHGN